MIHECSLVEALVWRWVLSLQLGLEPLIWERCTIMEGRVVSKYQVFLNDWPYCGVFSFLSYGSWQPLLPPPHPNLPKLLQSQFNPHLPCHTFSDLSRLPLLYFSSTKYLSQQPDIDVIINFAFVVHLPDHKILRESMWALCPQHNSWHTVDAEWSFAFLAQILFTGRNSHYGFCLGQGSKRGKLYRKGAPLADLWRIRSD